MTRKSAMAFFALVLGITLSTATKAQDIKLYAFSSGALTIGKGALVNFAPMEPMIQVPVGFYVIKHPKGTVLFDTGNNDKIITDPSYWGASFNALKPVNTEITPEDVTYLVVSHLPHDHGGNVRKVSRNRPSSSEERGSECFGGTRHRQLLIGDVLPLRHPTRTTGARSICFNWATSISLATARSW
jgi:glyoxylase-like metal-dependent hydrolase (beta-lactamase superfamily II)